MKKIFILNYILILFSLTASAQYTTPGNGISWDLVDLVSHSNGVITVVDEVYYINDNLTISQSDTIKFEENTVIKFESEKLITILGVFIVDPPDSILFTAIDTLLTYKSFRFENSNASILKNCIVEFGGGVDVLNSNLMILDCIFRKNDKSNSTGVIDLFFSNPQILNCEFYYNEGPAVMSGANSESSPFIYGNTIFRNNTVNANMPQINLGTSSPGLPIQIIKNTIEGFYNKAGGIAVTTLAGGDLDCIIDSNLIYNNRYGITAYGFDITSVISNNCIHDNNIENLPMQGGSGINFWGGVSNAAVVFGNDIYGNLWGITNTGDALPNIGQVEPDTVNVGRNKIYNNGNLGVVYALYNNTPNAIFAENNYWGSYDMDSVEQVIFHYPDDETLGLVDYLPIMDSLITRTSRIDESLGLLLFPNPADSYICIRKPGLFTDETKLNLYLYNSDGQEIVHVDFRSSVAKIDVSDFFPGIYFIEITNNKYKITSKFIKY